MKSKSFTKAYEVLPQVLIDFLEAQYPTNTVERILDGYMSRRPVTLRANTLKTDIASVMSVLWEEGLKYERVPWYKDALILKNATLKGIQKTDIYKTGQVYLQSLSSMLPPLCLNPKENSFILDMAAAPGGKTTQLAALIHNQGHILANEANALRAETLKYNVHLQGASCIEVSVGYGQSLSTPPCDYILLDAPCSGSGTISVYDSQTYRPFSEKLVTQSAKIQAKLLKRAVELVRPGGRIVYSTCSVLKKENEDVVGEILQNYDNISLVPLDQNAFAPISALNSTLSGALLVAPSKYYEGFFIAVLKKKKAK